jgi:hypothetical protein
MSNKITNACNQRKIQMLYNIPPSRYDVKSPYNEFSFTQRDYDMRRKIEILKYEGNKTNTKTNMLTKKERWSQIVNSKIQPKILPTNTKIFDCSLDDYIPTPTSSCNIPGPITYLVYNKNVPLYNYKVNNFYSIINKNDLENWQYFINNDIIFSNGINTKLMTLYIKPNVELYSYTYSFSIPIGFYVFGTNINTSLLNNDIAINDISLNIDSIELSVYYNDVKVKLEKSVIIQPQDISMNYNLSLTSTVNRDVSYNIISYLGTLNVSNLYLFTEPGYIYDIYLKFNLSTDVYTKNVTINTGFINQTIPYSSIVRNTIYGIYCNLSPNNKKIENNAIINSIQPSGYSSFSFNGL